MFMKKFFLLFIIFLTLAFSSLAVDETYFNSDSLYAELEISNDFKVESTGRGFYVEKVSAFLNWFPRTDYRQVEDWIKNYPSGYERDNSYEFVWKNPVYSNFELKQESGIILKSEFIPIEEKISFPLENLDPEYIGYLQPQDIIEITPEIKALASRITKDEDDAFVAVAKIGQWVYNNIEYNLSSLTAEASQKSGWVLENRQGVCDEITSLFVSMVRSVGIPARFVTGLSYSNVNLENDGWGAHGWAEVYYPDYGWVSYDITYKELGYIDASHIKLKEGYDTRGSSIDYSTFGRDNEIVPGPIDFDVKITDKIGKRAALFNLEVYPVQEEIGFESYNMLIVNISNPYNHYVASRITLGGVNGLEIIGDNHEDFILKPKGKTQAFFIVAITDQLESGYTYNFPVRVYGPFEEKASSEFTSFRDAKHFSKEYFETFIEDEEEQKPYSESLFSNCEFPDSIYLDEEFKVSCSLENKASRDLNKLNVCFNNQCTFSSLKPGEEKIFSYNVKFDKNQVMNLVFSAESSYASSREHVIFEVKDRPNLRITGLDYPENIGYDNSSKISFSILKSSHSQPRNVKLIMNHSLSTQSWNVNDISDEYEFTISIRGSDLKPGENNFDLSLYYEDDEGKPYQDKKTFVVDLNNVSFGQRFMIWLNILSYNLDQWFFGSSNI
jgi:transglutaminase-like putative cysteine protease